ncbi:helix-turn-helix domain-containing protein [Bradyrhizobium sp. USDA 4529]
MTPTLIKAARALLGFDQAALAQSSGISRKTLSLIEIDDQTKLDARRRDKLAKLRTHMEDELGVQFIFASGKTGEGVWLKRGRSKI